LSEIRNRDGTSMIDHPTRAVASITAHDAL
jgi:hypothetical protein